MKKTNHLTRRNCQKCDLNNIDIADLMSDWLKEKELE